MQQVDHTFVVKGVGSVISGTAVAGSIAVGQRLLLGPNSDGVFTDVVITGIQRSQVSPPPPPRVPGMLLQPLKHLTDPRMASSLMPRRRRF